MRDLKMRDNVRVGVATVVAGIAIGIAGWLLKLMVKTVSKLVLNDFDVAGGNWWLILVPVVGFVAVGLFVRHIVKLPLEDGTAQLATDIKNGNGAMPRRLTFSSMIASALTLGFGGSAGSEGPIAYTGAAVGSNVARWFGLTQKQTLIFLACGAGAGIAAIFKAPIGGMFFTIEVLGMALGTAQLLMLTTMCLLAGLTAYVMSGCVTDMQVFFPLTFDFDMLPELVLLGIAAGGYSFYYRLTGHTTRIKIRSLRRPIARNVVSGLCVGVLLFLFPALYGEGYNVLSSLANEHLDAVVKGSVAALDTHAGVAVWVMAGILLVKGIACYATNSGGGVAGEYAPTLFAGGVFGAFVYFVMPHVGVWCAVPTDTLVVCGMAAVMAGVIRAPLMTIFLVVEMTQSQQLLVPVALVALLSWQVSVALDWIKKRSGA